jgi:hypothetical protein
MYTVCMYGSGQPYECVFPSIIMLQTRTQGGGTFEAPEGGEGGTLDAPEGGEGGDAAAAAAVSMRVGQGGFFCGS